MANVKDIKGNLNNVAIELGGKEYTVKYDMNAFGELENMYGSVDKALETLSAGKIGGIKNLLWAGIIHDQVEEFDKVTGEPLKYKLTPYQVGAMMGIGDITAISGKLTTALVSSMPNPENLSQELKDKFEDAGIEVPQQTPQEGAAVVELTPEEAAKEAELKNA